MSGAAWSRRIMLVSLVAAGPLACSSNEAPPEQSPPAATTATQTPSGRPHGDHDPHHGGLVLMDRDLHFEVVMRDDAEYRVYFTDEVRKALPASTVSDVIITVSCEEGAPEVVGLQIDEKDESWVGRAHHPVHDPEATARVSYVYRDAPYWIDVPVKALQSPPAKGGDHAATGSGSQHD